MRRTKNHRRAKAPRVRLLLAGSEPLVGEAFRALLEAEFDVLGTVTEGRSLVHACRKQKPDVVVFDIAMQAWNGLDTGRELLAACPSAKLVFLTNRADPKLAAEALRLGAAGYVLKTAASGELKSAIRAAATGRSGMAALTSLLEIEDGASDHLTGRQKEVLQLIAEGRSMKEVAEILHVTPRTVAFHKYNMMDRLQVKSTAELVQFAVKNGVIGPAAATSRREAAGKNGHG